MFPPPPRRRGCERLLGESRFERLLNSLGCPDCLEGISQGMSQNMGMKISSQKNKSVGFFIVWTSEYISIPIMELTWTPRSNPCSPYWRETFHWKRGVVCGKRWWTPTEIGRFGWFHWTRYIFGHHYYASNISTNISTSKHEAEHGTWKRRLFEFFKWYALGGFLRM